MGTAYDLFRQSIGNVPMILKLIYQLIVLFLSALILYDVFKEKSRWMQLTAALSLIPFVLRLLMIK